MVERHLGMDGKAPFPPDALLELARRGDQDALGELLEGYRRYVELMARIQLDRTIQRKIAPSDVAQETFSQAHRCFDQFRGTTEGELLQWLRRIVASQLATVARRLHAQRRDVRLEEQLGEELDQSSDAVGVWLTANGSSPSQAAARREQAVVLANALAELRPDYREVIILRHLEGMEFSEIALRMGKTIASIKNIWARAIAALRKAIPESQ
jgi:RNA polymerase sigma-70 factor (ECF subfamily)